MECKSNRVYSAKEALYSAKEALCWHKEALNPAKVPRKGCKTLCLQPFLDMLLF
jgi:hypothetical protein